MGVLVWRSVIVILGILCTYFEQAGGEEFFKATEKANPNFQKQIQLKCRDACSERGDTTECGTQISGFCFDRYYFLCMRNSRGQCVWRTIERDCVPPSSGRNQMLCKELKIRNEKLRNMFRSNFFDMKRVRRENQDKRLARQGKLEIDEGTLTPAFRYNSRGRRKLPSSVSRSDQSYSYPMDNKVYKGPTVSTSGNAHAYATDGNQIAESHYGGPAVVSPYPTTQSATTPSYSNYRPLYSSYGRGYGHNNIRIYGRGYPQSHGQSYPQPYRPSYSPTVAPATRPYAVPGFGRTWNGYLPSSNPGPGVGHSRASPFSDIFHSVGLEDPFLMLQQLPEVALTHASATAGFNPTSKPRPPSPQNIANEASAFTSAAAGHPSNIYGSWLFPAMFRGNSRGVPTVWSFAI